MAKNLPANAGEVRDVGSIPGLGRSFGEDMATHPVFLPGEFHGQRRAGYSPWVSKEPGKTEQFNNNKCCVCFRCTAK